MFLGFTEILTFKQQIFEKKTTGEYREHLK